MKRCKYYLDWFINMHTNDRKTLDVFQVDFKVLIIGECRIEDDEIKCNSATLMNSKRNVGRIDTKKIKTQ